MDSPIDCWIARLNEFDRGQATYELAAIGVEAIPSLVSAAHGHWKNRFGVECRNDRQIRRGAIIALRLMGPSAADALPMLTQVLSDSDPVLRMEAAMALGAVGRSARSAVTALESLRHDPNHDVRVTVLEVLRQLAAR